ncbi:hypothetical protein H257_09832 [Aphanomyces astaci]|uniref:Chromo domain-containing protein n=1 Tax=Aphanomyces astaci TaxID=112090 RepID=W4G819_APHAT|nr:hypothetical protein H257_09832 [Aphanomyces astaci]ETV75857.1 hypothetical protein H257_09832 [Aphanomyces astaci]|eukprot:XP_009834499.1 hypothetical protein H257_09832 [Aphanomyces astaci]
MSAMLTEVEDVSGKCSRQYHDKKGVRMAQFVVGDYVLYQDAWAYLLGKNWVYDVENQLTHDVRPIHASRLKFYADCDLDVIFELLDQVTHNSEEFDIKAMVDARCIPTTKVCELLIKWRRLQDVENMWEPADNIFTDVPVMFKAFCKAANDGRQYTQDTTFKDVRVQLMKAFEDLTPSSIKGCIHKADRQLNKLAAYNKEQHEGDASDSDSDCSDNSSSSNDSSSSESVM